MMEKWRMYVVELINRKEIHVYRETEREREREQVT